MMGMMDPSYSPVWNVCMTVFKPETQDRGQCIGSYLAIPPGIVCVMGIMTKLRSALAQQKISNNVLMK